MNQVLINSVWTDIDVLQTNDISHADFSANGLQLRTVDEESGCISPVHQYLFDVDVFDDSAPGIMTQSDIDNAFSSGFGLSYAATRYADKPSWSAAVVSGELPAIITYSDADGKFKFEKGLNTPLGQVNVWLIAGIPVKNGTTVLSDAAIDAALADNGIIYNSTTYTDKAAFVAAILGNETDLDSYDSTSGKFLELSSSSPSEVSVSVVAGAAKEVLFVVGNATTPEQRDTDIATLLEANNYNITYVLDSAVVIGDSTDKDLILMSASADDANAESIFASTAIPLFAMSASLADGHGMTSGAATTGFTQNINVDDNSHAITAGFSTGVLDVLTSNTGLLYATSYGSGIALASEDGVSSNKTVVYWNSGVQMANASNAPAKRLICFLSGQAGKRLESNGETLIVQGCNWLTI
ncbi:MAG: hypothetical protein AAF587_29685 [Bacteroidota bacterium]